MPKMMDGQGEVVLAVVKSMINSAPISSSLSRQGHVVIDSVQSLRLNLAGLGINRRDLG